MLFVSIVEAPPHALWRIAAAFCICSQLYVCAAAGGGKASVAIGVRSRRYFTMAVAVCAHVASSLSRGATATTATAVGGAVTVEQQAACPPMASVARICPKNLAHGKIADDPSCAFNSL